MANWIWSWKRDSLFNFDQFVEIYERDLVIYGRMADTSEIELLRAETHDEAVQKLLDLAVMLGAARPISEAQ